MGENNARGVIRLVTTHNLKYFLFVADVSFFIYFVTRSPSSLGRSPLNMIGIWVRLIINASPNIRGPSSKKIDVKHAKFGPILILYNLRLIANISGESRDTSKIEEDFCRFRRRIPVNFGLHTRNALEINQGLLVASAHTTTGTESPKKNMFEHLKLGGLNFSVCARKTLGLVGVNSRNCSTRRAARKVYCDNLGTTFGRPAS